MKDVNITANTGAQKDALKKSGKWLVRPNGYYPLWEVQATMEAGYEVAVVMPFAVFDCIITVQRCEVPSFTEILCISY